MTYMTLNVWSYRKVSEGKSDDPADERELLHSLAGHARHCSVSELGDWAKRKGIPIHYVDNAWITVDVNGEALHEFYRDALDAPPTEFEPPIEIDGRYTIEAEEF